MADGTVKEMAVGQIQQEFSAKGLPPGVKLLITDVTFKLPPSGGWSIYYQGPNGRGIDRSDSVEEKRKKLPFIVTKENFEGWIGTVYTKPDISDSGDGPEIYLKFKLDGTTTVNGKPIDLGHVEGFLTSGTTKWGYIARPDFSLISYQVQNRPPQLYSNPVPSLQTPLPILLVFGANSETHEVGINASTEFDVVKFLIEYALKGIFAAHKKAIGWVVGKV